jgi:hypothetical protein
MHASVVPPARPFKIHRTLLLHAGFTSAGLLLGVFCRPLFPSSTPPVPLPARPGLFATAPSPASPPDRRGISRPITSSTSSPGDEAALLTSLREVLTTNRSDVRRVTRLMAWADDATEAELKLALTLGGEAARSDDEANLIDGVVLSRLAEIDGEMARQTMNTLNRATRPLSPEAKRALFESWLAWDPQGAATGALAQFQQEPEQFGSAMNHIIREIGRDFPGLARDIATQLARSTESDAREVGYEAHASLMRLRLDRGEDCSSAQAWIEATQVSADERRRLLETLVAHNLDHEKMSDALQVFRRLDPTQSPELTTRLVCRLCETAPQTARQFAVELPAGELRREVTGEVAAYLLRDGDPAAVLGWLGQQPAHADFDSAFSILAQAFADTDLPSAWQCVTRLTDQSAEKRSLSHELGFQWLASDYARAAQTLPADLVQRYDRTTVLLTQLAALYPEAKRPPTLVWEEDHLRCGGTL